MKSALECFTMLSRDIENQMPGSKIVAMEEYKGRPLTLVSFKDYIFGFVSGHVGEFSTNKITLRYLTGNPEVIYASGHSVGFDFTGKFDSLSVCMETLSTYASALGADTYQEKIPPYKANINS